MSDVPGKSPEKRFEVRATAEAHFSWLRTRLSVEGTLMSWDRTGIALIGFGFTIYQVLHSLNAQASATEVWQRSMPWLLGLVLIGSGTLALIAAAIEYALMTRYISSGDFKAIAGKDYRGYKTPVFISTIILAIIGLCVFLAVFFSPK